MSMEEIEFTIGPEGQVQMHVNGVKGSKCVDVTKPIEEALGGDVVDREFTSEYYEQAQIDTGRGVRVEEDVD